MSRDPRRNCAVQECLEPIASIDKHTEPCKGVRRKDPAGCPWNKFVHKACTTGFIWKQGSQSQTQALQFYELLGLNLFSCEGCFQRVCVEMKEQRYDDRYQDVYGYLPHKDPEGIRSLPGVYSVRCHSPGPCLDDTPPPPPVSPLTPSPPSHLSNAPNVQSTSGMARSNASRSSQLEMSSQDSNEAFREPPSREQWRDHIENLIKIIDHRGKNQGHLIELYTRIFKEALDMKIFQGNLKQSFDESNPKCPTKLALHTMRNVEKTVPEHFTVDNYNTIFDRFSRVKNYHAKFWTKDLTGDRGGVDEKTLSLLYAIEAYLSAEKERKREKESAKSSAAGRREMGKSLRRAFTAPRKRRCSAYSLPCNLFETEGDQETESERNNNDEPPEQSDVSEEHPSLGSKRKSNSGVSTPKGKKASMLRGLLGIQQTNAEARDREAKLNEKRFEFEKQKFDAEMRARKDDREHQLKVEMLQMEKKKT